MGFSSKCPYPPAENSSLQSRLPNSNLAYNKVRHLGLVGSHPHRWNFGRELCRIAWARLLFNNTSDFRVFCEKRGEKRGGIFFLIWGLSYESAPTRARLIRAFLPLHQIFIIVYLHPEPHPHPYTYSIPCYCLQIDTVLLSISTLRSQCLSRSSTKFPIEDIIL